MGTTLTSKRIKDTYSGLLKTTDNAVIDGTLRKVTDGQGNVSAMSISNTDVRMDGDLELDGGLKDINGYVGTSGQILMSNGAEVLWVNENRYTGWADYDDNTYSTGSPFLLTTAAGQIALPNHAQSVKETQLPDDVDYMYFAQSLDVSSVTGSFSVGETITGGTSGATADIHAIDGSNIKVVNYSLTPFTLTETITGGTSGATATLDTLNDGAITGRDGDGIAITIEFKASPTTAASNVRVQTTINIGGAVGDIYFRDFLLTKGSGVVHYCTQSVTGYTLDTWEANGGIVKIQAFNSNVNIYDIRYVITRTHKAR